MDDDSVSSLEAAERFVFHAIAAVAVGLFSLLFLMITSKEGSQGWEDTGKAGRCRHKAPYKEQETTKRRAHDDWRCLQPCERNVGGGRLQIT